MSPRLARMQTVLTLLRAHRSARPTHSKSLPSTPRPTNPNRIYGSVGTWIFGAFCVHLVWRNLRSTEGVSMIPTLYLEDWVLASYWYRRGRGVKVGDIVSAQHPYEPGEVVIKRVVGMPGDFVCAGADPENGGVMIQVPQGHCFLAGDNQEFSRDSRYYGPVPLALIKGKAVAVVSKLQWLKNPLTKIDHHDLKS